MQLTLDLFGVSLVPIQLVLAGLGLTLAYFVVGLGIYLYGRPAPAGRDLMRLSPGPLLGALGGLAVLVATPLVGVGFGLLGLGLLVPPSLTLAGVVGRRE